MSALIAGALSCQTPSAPAPTSPSPRTGREVGLAAALVELAEDNIDRGELDAAQEQLDRALVAAPDSPDARVALARITQARGHSEESRRLLEEAIALDPQHVDALVDLGTLEAAAGHRERAVRLLKLAVRLGPRSPRTHHALASVTGPAPALPDSPPESAADQALANVGSHPYDLANIVRAARALRSRGETEGALMLLNNTLWFGDLDRRAFRESIALLREMDPKWKDRRIVRVHCYADESITKDPWWQWRMRLLWLSATQNLSPVLNTAFIPTSTAAVQATGGSAQLTVLRTDLETQAEPLPAMGIVAGFTQKGPPAGSGPWKMGEATFMGETLVIRLEHRESQSRTLLHEILHLYGAVHVSDEYDSLMNPRGDSVHLDALNQVIVGLLVDRRFSRAGRIEEDVLPFVDVDALSQAYTDMLLFNLQARQSELEDAEKLTSRSQQLAATMAASATELDDHMAQVAIFIAELYGIQGKLEEARDLFKLAAKLLGPQTPEGEFARLRARAIGQALRRQRLQ